MRVARRISGTILSVRFLRRHTYRHNFESTYQRSCLLTPHPRPTPPSLAGVGGLARGCGGGCRGFG